MEHHFEDSDIDDIAHQIEKLGFSPHCTEIMYCGITGRKMEAQKFIGPLLIRLKVLYFVLYTTTLQKYFCVTIISPIRSTYGISTYVWDFVGGILRTNLLMFSEEL